jgi:hypothetical protein
MQSSSAQPYSPGERLYFMDWLRVYAILAVFLVHSSMPFQTIRGVWLIQFERTHMAFTLLPAFIYQWIMPLCFFLAGASTQLAMRSRERSRYLGERARRLLIPLIFGSLAFTPLQGFLSIKSWQFSGGVPAGANPWISIGLPRELAGSTFLQFYPQYLANCFHVPGSVLLRIGCFTSHLWFLAFLLIYSVICLPLFERLGGAWGAQWVDRLAAICQKPWGLLACFLPTAAVQILLRARFSQHHHWSDFLFWLVYFI